MSGNDGAEDKQFLNNIFNDMLNKTNTKPNIFIHVGNQEKHYFNHVQPLIGAFEKKEIQYTLDLGDYSEHKDVVKFYPDLLKNKVRETFNYPMLSIEEMIKRSEEKNQYSVKIKSDSSQNEFACYLYKDREKVKEMKYSKKRKYRFSIEGSGKYHLKIFAKNSASKVYSKTQPAVFF
ncbi:hypothetical protein [Halolactibacillus sp. JCM 19043]|uniref:hypothetical protein n=1 Tax=Halolactibacillus sp. JCM 19043 TaxID=1460638 RepID=UPI00078625B5|nr:hypothetical protein [Halolactibacillus sp. JCM 19043]